MFFRDRHGPHTGSVAGLAWIVSGVLCLGAAFAPAAAGQSGAQYPSSAPGAPCATTGASAQNQYCEDIPGASGPQTPGSGSTRLGATLPPRTAAHLIAVSGSSAGAAATRGTVDASGAAATSRHGATATTGHSASVAPAGHGASGVSVKKLAAASAASGLMALPAAGRRLSLASAPASSASAIAPYGWLIALLVALALAAVAIGVTRHRRTPAP